MEQAQINVESGTTELQKAREYQVKRKLIKAKVERYFVCGVVCGGYGVGDTSILFLVGALLFYKFPRLVTCR